MVFNRTHFQFPDSDVTRPKFTTNINKCIITVQYNNKTEKLEISPGVDLVRGETGQLAGNGRSEESKKCSQDAQY